MIARFEKNGIMVANFRKKKKAPVRRCGQGACGLRVVVELVDLGFGVSFPCVAVLWELLGIGFRCAKVVLCGHEADDIAGLEIQGLAEFGKRDEVHAAATFDVLYRLIF